MPRISIVKRIISAMQSLVDGRTHYELLLIQESAKLRRDLMRRDMAIARYEVIINDLRHQLDPNSEPFIFTK